MRDPVSSLGVCFHLPYPAGLHMWVPTLIRTGNTYGGTLSVLIQRWRLATNDGQLGFSLQTESVWAHQDPTKRHRGCSSAQIVLDTRLSLSGSR